MDALSSVPNVDGTRCQSKEGAWDREKTCVQYHVGGRLSDTCLFVQCITTAPKQKTTEEAGSSTTENLLVTYRFQFKHISGLKYRNAICLSSSQQWNVLNSGLGFDYT